MARHVFYSFHYQQDCHRASQVRNIGAIEGNREANPNEWESIKRAGDGAIKGWIETQLKGKSCTVVLIGAETASRKWVLYEIERSWHLRKGLLGIYIHNLKNLRGEYSSAGINPFTQLGSLSKVVPVYDPSGYDGRSVYATIASNIAHWIDDAIDVRGHYE